VETAIVRHEQDIGLLSRQKQELQSKVAAAGKQRAGIEKRLAKVERQENLEIER
jgi:hypothetical protein